MKNISILGSTGSIGTQTLDVIRKNKSYKVVSLSANANIDLLEKQIFEFKPEMVAVGDEKKALELKRRLVGTKTKVTSGMDGLIAVSTHELADVVVTSVVGMIGLIPTLEAIKANKTIALANKETLVTAGEIVMREAFHKKVSILPVDSEHCAIFQCLKSGKKNEVSKIILTASGGPFRGKSYNDLTKVGLEDALNHPTWSMGKKISIDSATLMNKGLEVIEAKWLFDVDVDNIDVLVHPQSIIHSMVEFIDGNVISQMGVHDMRIPIQYALDYPNREHNDIEKLDLAKIGSLTFEKPDMETFKCLKLALNALKEGGTMPSVLNGANEMAVKLFLENKIRFLDIPELIGNIMVRHKNIINPSLEDVLESDKWSRREILNQLSR